MGWIEQIQTSLKFVAVSVQKNEIKQAIEELGNCTINIPKIPRIIHQTKNYDTFSFNATDLDRMGHESIVQNDLSDGVDHQSSLTVPVDTMYILLKDQPVSTSRIYKLVIVEVILNANFFSHTEILHKLISDDFQLSAYEVIGDIIHLNLTEEQQKYKGLIGDVLHFKTGKTVINKTGKIEDTYRFYRCEVLAGPPSLVTVHRENGVEFVLDLGEVYWCSRLQTERSRILNMVNPGETVCDPFCGVGPHIVPALKKGAKALCNDLSPDAIKWLKKTLEINSLGCDCIENTDASEFLNEIKDYKIDHLIFNLPEHSLEYLKYTRSFKDCWLHVFFFCKEDEDPSRIIEEKTGYKTDQRWLRKVRKVSPLEKRIKARSSQQRSSPISIKCSPEHVVLLV